MPVPMLKSLAKKSGKSLADAEKYWDEAKQFASEKFKKKDDRYWAYVAGITKRRLGLNESTFKTFLNESEDDWIALYNKGIATLEDHDDLLFDNIKKDCSEFIKESKYFPVFRGMKFDEFFNHTKASSGPRNSSKKLTKMLNTYFENKFGIKAMRTKNRIYGTGDYHEAKLYAAASGDSGKACFIFPVNGYKYIWSPKVRDATTDLERISSYDGFIKELDEKNFTNKDLAKGIISFHEITFQTPSYYSIPVRVFGQWSRKEISEIYKKLCEEKLS